MIWILLHDRQIDRGNVLRGGHVLTDITGEGGGRRCLVCLASLLFCALVIKGENRRV